ncbi:MAG: hypothetical protein JWP34_4721 [Massilia sp.]|nr:hypothetical protein [Massilia sp.]
MALVIIPPPRRGASSQVTWPDGEPQPVRDLYDVDRRRPNPVTGLPRRQGRS